MENIGTLLKETREEKKISLEEAHEGTKVSIQHLQYLEENNFKFLPETYVKSFLKTYANFLGLNAGELVQEHQKDVEEEKKQHEDEIQAAEEIVPTFQPTNQLTEWALGIGALVLLFSIIFLYVQYRSQIRAEPLHKFQLKTVEHEEPLAAISVHRPNAKMLVNEVSLLELQVTAQQAISLKLTIDGKKVSEYTMSKQKKLFWTAGNRFDILIRKVESKTTDNFQAKNADTAAVRLSITKDVSRQGAVSKK